MSWPPGHLHHHMLLSSRHHNAGVECKGGLDAGWQLLRRGKHDQVCHVGVSFTAILVKEMLVKGMQQNEHAAKSMGAIRSSTRAGSCCPTDG